MKTLAPLLLMLAAVPILPRRGAAQAPRAATEPPPVAATVGDRVRISRFGGSARAGRLVARTSDSLVVRWMNGSQERVPVFEVGRLEVSRGRRRYLIGGPVGGLAVGAGIGLLLRNVRDHDMGDDRPSNSNIIPVSIASGTVLGTLIGAMGTERWQPAPVSASATRIGLVMPAQRGGIGVAVSGRW